MSSNLRVLVVSNDRALLRQTAFLLEEFGYEPVCYADPALALASRSALLCDFLIVDHNALAGDFGPIKCLKQRSGRDQLQVYLLHSNTEEMDVELAVESGVDDFLRKPLSIGEILARLRAGARYCEFQRRNGQQQWQDPLTGLASRKALLEHLTRRLAAGRAQNATLAIVEIDLFPEFAASRGRESGNRLIETIAAAIERACTAGQLVAYLQEGKFAVLLRDYSLEEARLWAEQLRDAISDLDDEKTDCESRTTVSVGIACYEESLTPEQLFQRAEDALAEAHHSGRDCLACFGQFEQERSQWRDTVQNGNPFRSTVALDVMTPVTLKLEIDDTVASAAAAFEQTKLDWLPVVDTSGRFQGMVERDEALELTSAAASVGDVMQEVLELPDSAPFRMVMDCFVRQNENVVAIVTNGHPVGIIAREQFLALIRPVSAELFASTQVQNCHDTDFLVVPDVVPAG